MPYPLNTHSYPDTGKLPYQSDTSSAAYNGIWGFHAYVMLCNRASYILHPPPGWALNDGRGLNKARAEAFNTLVFGEIGYSITTRFIKHTTFTPKVLRGNIFVYLSIGATATMQVCLVGHGAGALGWPAAAGAK